MGWLTKILKGPSHKISKGQYHGKYEDDIFWERPPASVDQWSDIDKEELDRADFDKEELDRAIALSIAEEDEKGKKLVDFESQLEEDEQLAKALQESWNVESPPRSPPRRSSPPRSPPRRSSPPRSPPRRSSPPRPPSYGYGSFLPPFPFYYPSGYRICAGCNSEIGQGRYLSCMGAVWHPECFRCNACDQPISDFEFSVSDNRPYHKSCYKDSHHPKCDVCKNFIPTNRAGLIEYRAHPFWHQKYCPSHENDGTPRCCSCERMEPVDARFLVLDDGRKLCLECLDSAIMDTHECQPLYLEIQEFYEGLNMKVEQQIPLLLVERQALNEAMEGEKNGHHHMPETRGLCLSEEQTVSTILRRPRIGGYRIIDMFTEPYRLIRHCEVTAILILYGLPRLLTGSILAHEMMHAWLRLKGYRNLSPDVEEGICQVLAHMWLDSEIVAGSGSNTASTSSSSSSSSASPSYSEASSSSSIPSSSGSSKKGKRSEFEKKLGEFFKHQIESDTSAAYGDGFREGNKAVLKYGLKRTLDHIRFTGTFPF
ncbi:Adaptor protein Enigma [Handroanthus impetiginosus]|uniref:Adaptor protein Enigma n=1 Tax=Handroanthus impetiginosus TaxID=429701 RepID=A0A2G9HVH5_9LAMI|nr:Adaptor protein Enigma [Handroanthus impetiginosus]